MVFSPAAMGVVAIEAAHAANGTKPDESGLFVQHSPIKIQGHRQCNPCASSALGDTQILRPQRKLTNHSMRHM